MYYILDEDNKPIKVDLKRWGYWFEKHHKNRHVDLTQIIKGVKVSTVFLGLDHNYRKQGPPILWETMVFGGEYDQYQRRYTSHDEAVKGHKEALKMVRITKAVLN